MNIHATITGVLDWVGQRLTGAPLWIQTPLVMIAVLLICVPLAVLLLKVVNTAAAVLERITGRADGRAVPSRTFPRPEVHGPTGVRIVSVSEPVVPED